MGARVAASVCRCVGLSARRWGPVGVRAGRAAGAGPAVGARLGGILAGMRTRYDAVVLAGGAGSRLGGADKPGLAVGGRGLLDRVLEACAGAGTTVVVGPRRATVRPVRWAREEPAGGGPLAALDAGLGALGEGGGGADEVLVLAADLPFLTAETVEVLAGALDGGSDGEWEGAMLIDPGGRDQPLAAVYRGEALRRELTLLRVEHGRLAGLPLRWLTGELRVRRVADPTGEASFDCDTWEDVAAARARLEDGGASEG